MITKPSLARNIRPLEDDFFGKSKDKTVNVTREKLAKIYHDNLKGITVEELVDMLTNKLIEIPQYLALLQGGNTCKKTSLLFNPHRLAINTAQGKNNFIESLKDDRFFLGLARVSLFHWNHGGNDQGLLDFLLGFGINGTTFAYEFPPHVARNLCKEFGVRMTDKVLDPCAGWGGRMLGISVVCNNYICYEPCSRTAGGLNKLHKFIQSFNPDFTARIRCAPFEDATLPNDFFDFAITSPPYYNTEKYSDELTNSCNRYLTFDSWCAGFYLPLIEKTMFALKTGSTFILNIGSRKYPLNDVMKNEFGKKYDISKLKNYLTQRHPKKNQAEGEAFYAITKN